MRTGRKGRIGILTSGGDCPGLNAVIRGAVNSAGRLGSEVVGFRRGFEGLVDPVSYIPLDTKNTSGIINRGGTILGSTNKGRFAARVGVEDRLDLDPELLRGVERTVDQLTRIFHPPIVLDGDVGCPCRNCVSIFVEADRPLPPRWDKRIGDDRGSSEQDGRRVVQLLSSSREAAAVRNSDW